MEVENLVGLRFPIRGNVETFRGCWKRVHPTFSPHPKSLSQSERGTLNLAPLLLFWEKGVGEDCVPLREEGKFVKLGCTRWQWDDLSLPELGIPREQGWNIDDQVPLNKGNLGRSSTLNHYGRFAKYPLNRLVISRLKIWRCSHFCWFSPVI